MNRTLRIVIWAIVVIVVIGGIWYGASKKSAEKEQIKIGAILPLTGKSAEFGNWMKQGLEMAAEKINSENGIDSKEIKILFEDSQGDAKTGLSAYNKLRLTNNIQYLFSSISGVVLAILPNAAKDNVLVITSATHPKITGGDYLAARIYFTPDQEAKAMAELAYDTLGFKKAGIIYLNDESLSGYNKSFSEKFIELGGQAYSESYDFGATDFRTQLTKIKAWKPDVLYIGGWKEIGIIIKQVRDLKINTQILGPITFDSPQTVEVAGKLANGVIFTTPAFDPKSDKKMTKSFREEYKTLFNSEPDVNVAIYYSGLQILSQALLNGDANNTKDIFSRITSLKNFETALGSISFENNGDILMPITFKTIKDGQFVPYEK